MSDTSNASTLRAPLSPARRRCHVGSTPQASGVTMPIPVTTTRLMWGHLVVLPAKKRRRPARWAPAERASIHHQDAIRTALQSGRPVQIWLPGPALGARRTAANRGGRWGSAFGVLFQEFDGIADGQDGLRGVVGDLAAELLF